MCWMYVLWNYEFVLQKFDSKGNLPFIGSSSIMQPMESAPFLCPPQQQNQQVAMLDNYLKVLL